MTAQKCNTIFTDFPAMNIVISTKNIMLGNISGIHRGFFEHPALDFAKRDQSASFLEVAEIGNLGFK